MTNAGQLQRRQDRADVAERFVEGGNLDAGSIPKLRLYGVENGVAQLVTDDIRTLARKDASARHIRMEEVSPWRS